MGTCCGTVVASKCSPSARPKPCGCWGISDSEILPCISSCSLIWKLVLLQFSLWALYSTGPCVLLDGLLFLSFLTTSFILGYLPKPCPSFPGAFCQALVDRYLNTATSHTGGTENSLLDLYKGFRKDLVVSQRLPAFTTTRVKQKENALWIGTSNLLFLAALWPTKRKLQL